MSSLVLKPLLVLAIDPSSQGFGFAALEGSSALIDWGAKSARTDKNPKGLLKVKDLIALYHPQVIVLENPTSKGSRRCRRIQHFLKSIRIIARAKRIKARAFSPSDMRRAFSLPASSTKHEIATIIARIFPELAPRLPPVRRPWMSQDYRMQIFDAVALALTFFSPGGINRDDAFSSPRGPKSPILGSGESSCAAAYL